MSRIGKYKPDKRKNDRVTRGKNISFEMDVFTDLNNIRAQRILNGEYTCSLSRVVNDACKHYIKDYW